MAQVTINGTIKNVGKVQDVSEKFRKRELVVTESGTQYPQHIPVEFTQDKCSMLDGFNPNEEVSVTCYVNGREWTGKDGELSQPGRVYAGAADNDFVSWLGRDGAVGMGQDPTQDSFGATRFPVDPGEEQAVQGGRDLHRIAAARARPAIAFAHQHARAHQAPDDLLAVAHDDLLVS